MVLNYFFQFAFTAQYLIRDIWQGDVIVDFDGFLVVHEKVHDVGHGGGHPATTLIEELVETLGTVSVSVTGS